MTAPHDTELARCLALAEAAAAEFLGPGQGAALDRLEREHDACVSALSKALARPHEASALRLVAALAGYWWRRGRAGEGRRLAEAALALPGGGDAERAAARRGAGELAYALADYPAARAHHEAAAAAFDRLGLAADAARARDLLGMAAREQGDLTTARACHEQALPELRRLGPAAAAGGVNNLGVVAFRQGDHAAARARHEEALALRRAAGDERGVASSLSNLAAVSRTEGDAETAAVYHEEALAIRRRLDDRWGTAGSLLGLAAAAGDRGRLAEAGRHLAEALPLLEAVGDALGEAEALEAAAALLRRAGEPRAAAALWSAAGRLRDEIGAPAPHHADAAAFRAGPEDESLTRPAARALALRHVLGLAG